MSRFFNPKEDVIDIQLTQYGKALLSRGKFKPDTYAFFDNDILYNSDHASLAESQNDTQQRIMDLTPRLQTQYVYRGIESDLQKNFDTLVATKVNVEKVNIQQVEEREYALGMSIGTADPNTLYRPAWDIGFYKAPLSGAIMYHTGSSERAEPIIQLDCDYYLKSGVMLESEDQETENPMDAINAQKGYRVPYDAGLVEPYSLSTLYDDDSSFYIKQDNYIFLDVVENNTSSELENFEVEVFKVEKESNPNISGSMREILIPLKFFKEEQHETLEFPTDGFLDISTTPDLDETFVEYYFNIKVDSDIDESVFCELLRIFKTSKTHTNLFSDLNVDPAVNCDDFRYLHQTNENIIPHFAEPGLDAESRPESSEEEC